MKLKKSVFNFSLLNRLNTSVVRINQGSISLKSNEKSVVEKRERISRKKFINRFGFEGVHNSETAAKAKGSFLYRGERKRERGKGRVSPRCEVGR